MKLPNPINSTNKTTKATNHLFYSKIVSGLLALMACTILTPKINHPIANYVDPRAHAAKQPAKDSDPGYDWFY